MQSVEVLKVFHWSFHKIVFKKLYEILNVTNQASKATRVKNVISDLPQLLALLCAARLGSPDIASSDANFYRQRMRETDNNYTVPLYESQDLRKTFLIGCLIVSFLNVRKDYIFTGSKDYKLAYIGVLGRNCQIRKEGNQ